MSRVFCFLVLILILVSCAHKVELAEEMLPDGNTWRVYVGNVNCRGLAPEECRKKLADYAGKRGADLCGFTPNRIFSCGLGVMGRSHVDFTCYVECSSKK